MRIIIFYFLLNFLIIGQANAQSRSVLPVIGQQIPSFVLNDVHYYTEKTFDPLKVKDKWIILDFWNTHCTSCVQSFPKVNALQNKFKDKVQFVLIGQSDQRYNKNIVSVYERYRKNYQLNLTSAYDTVLFDQFKIQGVPYIVIIDPSHKVYAITYGSQIDSTRLEELVNNQRPVFPNSSTSQELKFWKYWTDKRDSTIIYQSVLSEHKNEESSGTWKIDPFDKKGYYYITGATLFQLYNIAYWGIGTWGRRDEYFTHSRRAVLEIKDSSVFKYNYSKEIGLYNYSLTVPKDSSSKQYLMKMMQRELNNYFNYSVTPETRLMPCWVLTATEGAKKKLISKSKSYYCEQGPGGVNGKKISIDYILELVNNYNDKKIIIPFLNETNLNEPIDIDFKAAMTDINDIIKSLRPYGLILQQGMRPMKVLVIHDK